MRPAQRRKANMTAAHNDTDDIITELTKDHDEVRAIFAKLRQDPAPQQREELVREMTVELVKHSVAEEVHLYPLIREVFPEGNQLADHEIEEHAEVEKALKSLEKMDPSDAQYMSTVHTVIDDVTHHAQEEEDDVFPRLRQTCSPEQLRELGNKIRATKKVAPTHPHPSAPDTPPANKILGPMAGLVDRVRDAITRK
jgi:hemerythrin superfamily protein